MRVSGATAPRAVGSSLPVRVISGLVLLALVAAALAIGSWFFVAVVAAASAVGAWEFAGLAARLDARPPLWLVVPLAVWFSIRFAIPGSPPALDIGLASGLVAGLAAVVVGGEAWRGWAAAIAGAVYVGFSLGFFVAIIAWRPGDHWFGVGAIVVPVAAVIVCDTAAYAVGSAIGRRPFFPQLSPRKSVEGALAGLIGAVIAAAVLGPALLGMSPWLGAVAGLLAGAAAQAGDLAESALKRQGGAKDSSRLIPGHGGLLDRLDSLILVAPVIYCLYRLTALG